jgi:hypothetical protein
MMLQRLRHARPRAMPDSLRYCGSAAALGRRVAIVHDGLIYVAGGRPPRGHDFAVYDPAADFPPCS